MNVPLTQSQAKRIRALQDFDLMMFLSELHEFGWDGAMRLLPMIEETSHMKGEDLPP